MNSSSGFNSSTGFKKRSLLRPPSGLGTRDKQKDFLRLFDISQSQPLIANQMKTQIIKIQQQINQLDKDKKLRTSDNSLQKSYVITLKKWLRQSSNADKQDDDSRIMKYMGVDSYEGGFRKLWKILSNVDNMISKITELEIIQFLKYDEIYGQLTNDSEKASIILQTLSKTGFTSGQFLISQVILERNKDLYSIALESKRKGGSIQPSLEKQTSKKSQTNELIAQLQKQNLKLSQLLQQLQRQKQNNHRLMQQLKSKEQIIQQNISKPSVSTLSSSNLDDFYKQRINQLSSQIHNLQSQISELKIIVTSTSTKLKLAEEDLKDNDPTKKYQMKNGSYQQALVQQMDKMKKGFEKKIQKLLDDFGLKQKQHRKKQIDYKTDNDKLKWEKGLLLKKFDALQIQTNK